MNLAISIDLLFLFVATVFAVKGLIKGFMGEIISLAATVVGVVLALRFAPDGSAMVEEIFDGITPVAAQAISMIVVFVVVVLVGALLNRIVRAFLSVTSLTFLDRLLGVVAGIVKSIAILMVAFVLLNLAGNMVPRDVWSKSKSMELASSVWPRISPYVMKNDFLREGMGGALPESE